MGNPDVQEYLIWNPTTGITDLNTDSEDLAVSEIPGIKTIWGDQQERLKGTNLVSEIIGRFSRE